MMPANFNLYSAWLDPYFYAWAAVFAAALTGLVYSARNFLALKGLPVSEEEAPAQAAAGPEAEDHNPFLEEPDGEKTLVLSPAEQQAYLPQPPAEPEAVPAPAAEPRPAPAPAPAAGEEHNRAENFVRGIYAGISDLDERMKGIESALSRGRVNSTFAVKFLEDMVQDIDTLDKAKIRARLEYLISDLKK